MKTFNFNYDSENDDLFVYLDGARSEGAIETGNFVLDFDKSNDLVAIQIIDASKMLSAVLSKIINLSNLREFRAESSNFRNMSSVRFTIEDDNGRESANILIPRITRSSPALGY